MPNIITVKVDVRKLDKARFFEGKADAQGHKPLYADLVLIPRREVGRFNDTHLVKQSKKKDEQVEMPIIGNATERGQQAQQPRAATPPSQPTPQDDDPNSVPF